jgi:hypothetical protein
MRKLAETSRINKRDGSSREQDRENSRRGNDKENGSFLDVWVKDGEIVVRTQNRENLSEVLLNREQIFLLKRFLQFNT